MCVWPLIDLRLAMSRLARGPQALDHRGGGGMVGTKGWSLSGGGWCDRGAKSQGTEGLGQTLVVKATVGSITLPTLHPLLCPSSQSAPSVSPGCQGETPKNGTARDFERAYISSSIISMVQSGERRFGKRTEMFWTWEAWRVQMTPQESPKEDNSNSENLRMFQMGKNGSWIMNREKVSFCLPASCSLQRKRKLHERRGRERGSQ